MPEPVSAGAERRQHVRVGAADDLKLVAPGGQVFEATSVDRSLRGMRVRLAGAAYLPSEVTVLVPASGIAHVARVVWRAAPFAGLLLQRSVEMRAIPGAGEAELRRLWREHVSVQTPRAG